MKEFLSFVLLVVVSGGVLFAITCAVDFAAFCMMRKIQEDITKEHNRKEKL